MSSSLEDPERLKILRQARRDLKYLLERGYKKASSIRFVGDHYQLDKKERLILYRSVYPRDEIKVIKSKMMKPSQLKGLELWIDGFNVLNTVEAALRGEVLLLCDDGVLRDFSEVYGGYKISENTWRALSLIAEALKKLSVSKTRILFESQISRSGIIASRTRKILEENGLEGTAETLKKVDSTLSKTLKPIATSDSAIILRCQRFFDLSRYIINALRYGRVIRLLQSR